MKDSGANVSVTSLGYIEGNDLIAKGLGRYEKLQHPVIVSCPTGDAQCTRQVVFGVSAKRYMGVNGAGNPSKLNMLMKSLVIEDRDAIIAPLITNPMCKQMASKFNFANGVMAVKSIDGECTIKFEDNGDDLWVLPVTFVPPPPPNIPPPPFKNVPSSKSARNVISGNEQAPGSRPRGQCQHTRICVRPLAGDQATPPGCAWGEGLQHSLMRVKMGLRSADLGQTLLFAKKSIPV